MADSYLSAGQPAIENKTPVAESKMAESKLVTENIINKYAEQITLTGDQRSAFTEILAGYIEEKQKILPLLESNRIDYDAKQSSYFNTLRLKLSNILLKTQLKKFMQLKPRVADFESNLYYIYY
ncbi:hypothetical protein DXN05_09150 [Deminuibacter soli]|uniref:Uncharacterized protein n=1 Tax=Deminuibacter soli TaxID=2291815 RepID=A0A3E1NLY2_9BACT|nr:hypothetical protein DXN05_09150 [Deminuibacter soli]